MSPGLQRAREPYRVKNAITGILLGAIGVGIWAYSISAVKQDEFDDVDEEARELRESGVAVRSLEDEARDRNKAAAGSHGEDFILGQIVEETATQKVRGSGKGIGKGKGVLSEILDSSYPKLLDPSRKTLVWGAPSVDNIGSMKDSTEWGSRKL